MSNKNLGSKSLKRNNTDNIRYSDFCTNIIQKTPRCKSLKVSTPKLPCISMLSNKRPSYHLQVTLIPPISPFKHTYQTLQIDLFHLLTQTFRKRRFSFEQNINYSQFRQLCRHILNVKDKPNTTFNLTQIVPIRSPQYFLTKIKQYPQQSDEYVGIVRYYLIAPEKIAQYQVRKIEDKLRRREFNLSYNFTKNAHLYRVEDGSQIKNIYELLKKGTYVLGEDEKAGQMYKQMQSIKAGKKSYKNYLLKIGQITHIHNLQGQLCKISSKQKKLSRVATIQRQKLNDCYNLCLNKHKSPKKHTLKILKKNSNILSHLMFLNLPTSQSSLDSYFQP